MNKIFLKQMFLLLVVFMGVMFALYIYFSAPFNGKKGLVKGTGTYVEAVMGTESNGGSNVDYEEDEEKETSTFQLKYIYGTQTVGACVKFKSLLTVTTEDGEKPGELEDDFTIYLNDITDMNGNSVVEKLSTEMIESLEEIPAAFIYDKELDLLYFHKSGAFVVYMNIYDANGYKTSYEFTLPVEVGGI